MQIFQYRPTKLQYRLAAFILLGAAMAGGFAIQNNDRYNAKRDTCTSVLEDRNVLAEVISNSQSSVQDGPIDPSLPASIRKLIEESRVQQKAFLAKTQRRFLKPIPICEQVGVESRVILRDENGIELVPLPVAGGVTTTTTNPPETTTTTTALNSTVVTIVGPPGPRGPTGPPGTSPSTTTTTTTPVTPPPTTPPPEPPGALCRLLGIGC